MILLICLIVFVVSVATICSEKDEETRRAHDYAVSERRHEEILRKMTPTATYGNVKKSKVIRRRIVKDMEGNIIAEEIIEEEV